MIMDLDKDRKEPTLLVALPPSLMVVGLIAFLSLLTPSISHAQITLTVINELNFGTITNENGECKIKSSGTLVGKSGQTCFGTGTATKLKIQGDPYTSVIISAFQGPAVNGITFIPKVVGDTVRILNSKGKKTFKVIGSLMLNNATAGAVDMSYTTTVNYE